VHSAAAAAAATRLRRRRLKRRFRGTDSDAMLWFALFFAIPAAAMAFVLLQVVRVAQRFRDPESLRELLSAEVRVALDKKGIQLDSQGMARLGESDELTRLVVADLRRAFRRAVFAPSSGAPTRTVAPAAPVTPITPGPMARFGRGPDRSAVPGLPAPIDAVPPVRARAVASALITLGLVTALAAVLARG
jgi:hypothetical protein